VVASTLFYYAVCCATDSPQNLVFESVCIVSDRCVGLMAKYWQPGKVKTRLAADIGPQEAAAIYREFVVTLQTRLTNTAEQKTIAYTPSEKLPEFQQAISATWQLEPQTGDNLGDRMHHFFLRRQQEGFRKTVLMGTDSPNVPLAYIEQAFRQLDDHPVVLGPTEDGGYWLVGSAGSVPPIFSNIPWSTPQVWQATLDALQTANLSCHILPTWYDVDEAADLQRLIADLRNDLQDEKSREAPLENLLQFLEKSS